MRQKDSLTGDYLAEAKHRGAGAETVGQRPRHRDQGARQHNLKDIDVAIPLGCFVAVTRVSGSGKSTLVNDVLYRSVHQALNRNARLVAGKHKTIHGLDNVDKVIDIDQSPIGHPSVQRGHPHRGLRSHPQALRQDPRRETARLSAGPFLFQRARWALRSVRRRETIKIEMHFLPDVYVPCEVCKGKRYNRETLEVRFKGKNISEVLEMSVTEACEFFSAIPPIARHMDTLRDVGLGYVKLGQPRLPSAAGSAAGQAVPPSYPSDPPARRFTSWTSPPPASTSMTSTSCSGFSTAWSARATRSS